MAIEAMAHLREKGFLHRDLKAENLLFNKSGQMLLGDIGNVKDLGGKPPEQVNAESRKEGGREEEENTLPSRYTCDTQTHTRHARTHALAHSLTLIPHSTSSPFCCGRHPSIYPFRPSVCRRHKRVLPRACCDA